MKENNVRKKILSSARQIIVKAGSRLLTDRTRIAKLVESIALLKEHDYQVLLVSSGAVAQGMQTMNLTKRPKDLASVQALSAIGQCRLMSIYREEALEHGFKVAQILLTAADLDSRTRSVNVMTCIEKLWEHDILPIINENDSVSVNELKFGDNDTVAAMLAELTGAELTVILTTEEGLRENCGGKLGKRISVVKKLDEKILAMAQGTDNAELSIGGMASKLKAARIIAEAGKYLWIADGREEGIFRKILAAEDVGTVFLPEKA